jgi:hypothetical protein
VVTAADPQRVLRDTLDSDIPHLISRPLPYM